MLKEGVGPEDRVSLTIRLKKVLRKSVRETVVDVVVQNTKRYEELSKDPFTLYAHASLEGRIVYEGRKSKAVA